jgi:hypothetical protein
MAARWRTPGRAFEFIGEGAQTGRRGRCRDRQSGRQGLAELRFRGRVSESRIDDQACVDEFGTIDILVEDVPVSLMNGIVPVVPAVKISEAAKSSDLNKAS